MADLLELQRISLSSSAPASMISGPSFRPAIAAAPSAQQQSQQYQHSPPLARPLTNAMGYYPTDPAPSTFPTASTRPGISPLATYSTSTSDRSSSVRPDSGVSNAVRPSQQQQQQQPSRPVSFPGEATDLRESTAPIQESRPTSARAALMGGTSHTTHAATQDAAAVPPRAAPPVASKSMPPTPLVSPTDERPPALHKQGNTRSSPAQVARRPSPPATSEFLRSFWTSGANMSAFKETPSSAAVPAPGATKVAPPAESQMTPQRAQPPPFATGSSSSKATIPTSLATLQATLGNGTPAATPQSQQRSNRNASGTAPTMSRRSIGSSAEAFTAPATSSEGRCAPTNPLDLAATNAQTRAAEAAHLTAAEVQASLTSTYFPHARHLLPPAQTSADTTSVHSMSIHDASTLPHVAAAPGNAVQNGSTGPDSAAAVLGKRKRPSVTATVEKWKRLAEEAPQALPPQATPSVSIAAPASSRSTAAAAPQQHSASTASNFGNVQAQAHSSTLPSPIQQTLSSLQPFAAEAQAAPPPQAQALPARAVNVQHGVPPPPPRTQFGASQQYQQQSDANMPPKKRARGRPKKTTEQQQRVMTMDVTDKEFDKAVAAARGAIQAFETARSAYAEGWRANPATSGAPLPPIARSRVRASADVVSASPWRDGKKQVCPSTTYPALAIDEPYGDYVPNTKPRAPPAPARTQAITQLSDPLFVTRPFPKMPASGGLPPVELNVTRKPCPATGRTMDLFAITPHPFYPYPAALKRLDKAEVDKALEHINKLANSSAQRVDLDQAASTTASGDKPDDRQRAQAIKTVLARHVRRAVQGSRPLELPEDLGSQKVPKLAKRTWKLVKKVYPGPTAAASTSSAAATASEGAATTAAAQSAQPPIKVKALCVSLISAPHWMLMRGFFVQAASSPPKQVSSTSAAQSSQDGVAPLPPQVRPLLFSFAFDEKLALTTRRWAVFEKVIERRGRHFIACDGASFPARHSFIQLGSARRRLSEYLFASANRRWWPQQAGPSLAGRRRLPRFCPRRTRSPPARQVDPGYATRLEWTGRAPTRATVRDGAQHDPATVARDECRRAGRAERPCCGGFGGSGEKDTAEEEEHEHDGFAETALVAQGARASFAAVGADPARGRRRERRDERRQGRRQGQGEATLGRSAAPEERHFCARRHARCRYRYGRCRLELGQSGGRDADRLDRGRRWRRSCRRICRSRRQPTGRGGPPPTTRR